MKTKLKYLLFLVLTMETIASDVQAQNFTEDSKKMQEVYLHLNNFYCELKIDMYRSVNSVKPDQVMKSVLKKKGSNTFTTMGTSTMLINDKCMLFMDASEKKIVYTILASQKKGEAYNPNVTGVLDSLGSKHDSVVFNGVFGDEKKYTIYTAKQAIIKTEVFIDQQTHVLSKLVYYYKVTKQTEFEKVIVDYDKVSFSPEFQPADFSEKKYVTIIGKQLKPTTAFAGYKTEIIDQNNIQD